MKSLKYTTDSQLSSNYFLKFWLFLFEFLKFRNGCFLEKTLSNSFSFFYVFFFYLRTNTPKRSSFEKKIRGGSIKIHCKYLHDFLWVSQNVRLKTFQKTILLNSCINVCTCILTEIKLVSWVVRALTFKTSSKVNKSLHHIILLFFR